MSAGYGDSLLRTITDSIEKLGHVYYDGYSSPFSLEDGRTDEVYARIWRADAAIFLAYGDPDPKFLSPDQYVEWAFSAAICKNSMMICHKSVLDKRIFMMPQSIFTLFDDLSSIGQLRIIRDEIERKLNIWFPR
jgi:hypothetical protein